MLRPWTAGLLTAFAVTTGCGEDKPMSGCNDKAVCIVDATPVSFPGCDPLEQLGCLVDEKCTWIIDRASPDYHGHIGCVGTGDKTSGKACTFASASAGADDCQAGLICNNFYGLPGVCTPICRLSSSVPPSCATGQRCSFSGGVLTVDEYNATYGAGYCE